MTGRADDRRPPYSEDAEQAVLAAILMDERSMLAVLELLDADSFYAEKHRRLFRAMVQVAERGQKIDPITVSTWLQGRGELDAAGGKEYIGFLLDAAPLASNVAHHAEIVREKATARRIIASCMEATDELFRGALPPSEIAAALQAQLLPHATTTKGEGFVLAKHDMWPLLERIEERVRSGGAVSPRVVRTGYPEIDDQIAGGFERGEFIVFAGVPGGCKTAAAMNVALNVAIPPAAYDPNGVLAVSAEMTREKLHMRNIANVARIDFRQLRAATLHADDFVRLARAAGVLSSAPLWVDQTPTPAIEDIVAKCRKEKAENPGIALIVVDFIQLVQRRLANTKNGRDENRAAELTAISYALKGLAKELDVAVIATCQVDAADIEKRQDKRPRLGDARWSQGMREAADLFATCYRDKMYNPDPMAPDTLELSFQKARDAEPFTATLNWQGQYMLLTSPKQRSAPPCG